MANYYCTSRTNYFKVKDETAFRAWVAEHDLTVQEKDGLFVLFPSESNDTGDFSLYEDTDDGIEPLDFCDELAAHLADDSVAVVVEAGAEKLCYVAGHAVAINSKGERVEIDLGDIYAMAAAKFGTEPTRAEY